MTRTSAPASCCSSRSLGSASFTVSRRTRSRRSRSGIWRSETASFAWKPARLSGSDGALRFANAAKAITVGARRTADADLSLAVNASAVTATVSQRSEGASVGAAGDSRAAVARGTHRRAVSHRRSPAPLTRSEDAGLLAWPPRGTVSGVLHGAKPQTPIAGLRALALFGIRSTTTATAFGRAQVKGHRRLDVHLRPPTVAFTSASATVAGSRWTRTLPLMREVLETAWARGFLTESLADSPHHQPQPRLEVPGIFDVAMQVRDLSPKVTSHVAHTRSSMTRSATSCHHLIRYARTSEMRARPATIRPYHAHALDSPPALRLSFVG